MWLLIFFCFTTNDLSINMSDVLFPLSPSFRRLRLEKKESGFWQVNVEGNHALSLAETILKYSEIKYISFDKKEKTTITAVPNKDSFNVFVHAEKLVISSF